MGTCTAPGRGNTSLEIYRIVPVESGLHAQVDYIRMPLQLLLIDHDFSSGP